MSGKVSFDSLALQMQGNRFDLLGKKGKQEKVQVRTLYKQMTGKKWRRKRFAKGNCKLRVKVPEGNPGEKKNVKFKIQTVHSQ